ncbi:3-hydroxyisobutyrate dehydrogenase [Rhizobiales bacterium GAS191]|nr:3-hydroxyisobutyrate dehydrogenase [Rhizobiales bacterium GAS191]
MKPNFPMSPRIAIIAPGNMGAAVGRRLTAHGIEVLTSLEGRSEASRKRAEAAGMQAGGLDQLAAADMVLSIVPPGEAVSLAEMLLPRLAGQGTGPLYVDCNAISPSTVKGIAGQAEAAGVAFVDAGIIGGPPRDGVEGPSFYASGKAASRFAVLAEHGLTVKVLEAPIGAASALKMSYAGITKGFSGLAAAMLLAASREGAAEALRAELGDSQAALLARFAKTLPEMYPKAYRWVAEMEEIAEFLGEDQAAATMFQGLARLYERLAADFASGKVETGAIDAFLKGESESDVRRGSLRAPRRA